MSTQSQQVYEFGPFRLDPENRLISRDGQAVTLTPKAFDILQVLVEHRGRLVLKDDLIKAVWPNTFVSDANLTQTIFMLRKALRDTGGDQSYITTVSGRGYRFAADVKQVGANGHTASEAPPAEVSTADAPAEAAPSSKARRWWPWVAVAALVLAGLAAYVYWSRPRVSAPVAQGKRIVAVLPFENLTGDAEQEYFIDGLSAGIIVQLSRVDPEHLGVIARSSVMRYKNGLQQLQRIARDLGVDYVVEGGVRRDGQKVRITVELVQVGDQTHVWARNYDRELSSPLLVQAEIAREVSDEIYFALGGQKSLDRAAQNPSASRQARDFYLRGRFFWNKRSASGLRHAVEFFQQAIAEDPNFAPAYSGLADSYLLMSSYYMGPAEELVPKARSAALRALELDDKSAEAHTSLALIAEMYDWDWQTAERDYRRAIQVDPNYATAHHWYAELLGFQGRFQEALVESERARKLDPLSLIIMTDHAAILYYAGQYDRAIEQIRVVLDMEPNFIRARSLLVGALVEKGLFADALSYVDTWYREDPSPWTFTVQACVYGRAGRKQDAQRAFQRFTAVHPGPSDDPTVAAALVAIGDKQGALSWLENGYAHHSSFLMGLKVDHWLDPLRNEPRFIALIRRVGLAQ